MNAEEIDLEDDKNDESYPFFKKMQLFVYVIQITAYTSIKGEKSN